MSIHQGLLRGPGSFTTDTNWPSYSGQSTMSWFTKYYAWSESFRRKIMRREIIVGLRVMFVTLVLTGLVYRDSLLAAATVT